MPSSVRRPEQRAEGDAAAAAQQHMKNVRHCGRAADSPLDVEGAIYLVLLAPRAPGPSARSISAGARSALPPSTRCRPDGDLAGSSTRPSPTSRAELSRVSGILRRQDDAPALRRLRVRSLPGTRVRAGTQQADLDAFLARAFLTIAPEARRARDVMPTATIVTAARRPRRFPLTSRWWPTIPFPRSRRGCVKRAVGEVGLCVGWEAVRRR